MCKCGGQKCFLLRSNTMLSWHVQFCFADIFFLIDKNRSIQRSTNVFMCQPYSKVVFLPTGDRPSEPLFDTKKTQTLVLACVCTCVRDTWWVMLASFNCRLESITSYPLPKRGGTFLTLTCNVHLGIFCFNSTIDNRIEIFNSTCLTCRMLLKIF